MMNTILENQLIQYPNNMYTTKKPHSESYREIFEEDYYNDLNENLIYTEEEDDSWNYPDEEASLYNGNESLDYEYDTWDEIAEEAEVLREVLHEDYSHVPSEEMQEALYHILDSMTPEEGFNFKKALRDIGNAANAVSQNKIVGQIARTALPVAGAAVGTIVGGPAGTAIGGTLGHTASQAFAKRPKSSRRVASVNTKHPKRIKSTYPRKKSPHGGSAAAAKLLQLTQNPDVLKSLLTLSLGSHGKQTIKTNNTGKNVKVGAVLNLLSSFLSEAVNDADQLEKFYHPNFFEREDLLNGAESIPSAELNSKFQKGINIGKSSRLKKMSVIGSRLGIPVSSPRKSQSKLYKGNDIRLLGVFEFLLRKNRFISISQNLIRVHNYVPDIDPWLVLVTGQREGHRSLTSRNFKRKIHTYYDGGIDFLWRNRNKLGLPQSIIKTWKKATPFINSETGNMVYPAEIPAPDEILGYAAQIRQSFENFKNYIKREIGDSDGNALFNNLTDESKLVWQAYAFLAPGGPKTIKTWNYLAKKRIREKKESKRQQSFGVKTAFDYIRITSIKNNSSIDLNMILTDVWLQTRGWIRSAKTRAAETIFMKEL